MQGENTLSCYIIVNKILIIRVIFHLPYCSPILVYICWLHFGLAFSNFCLFRHMLAAVTCFCFSYFLPNKYLLIPNCFRHGAHLTLTPLCFSERIQCSHLNVGNSLCKYYPQLTPVLHHASTLKSCYAALEIQQTDQNLHLNEHCSS